MHQDGVEMSPSRSSTMSEYSPPRTQFKHFDSMNLFHANSDFFMKRYKPSESIAAAFAKMVQEIPLVVKRMESVDSFMRQVSSSDDLSSEVIRAPCLPGPLNIEVFEESVVPVEIPDVTHINGSIYSDPALPSDSKDAFTAVEKIVPRFENIAPLPQKFINMLQFLSIAAVRIRMREEGVDELSLDHYLAATNTDNEVRPSVSSRTIQDDTSYFLRNVFSVHVPKLARDRKTSSGSDNLSENSSLIGRNVRGRSRSGSPTINPAVAHHIMNSYSRDSTFSKYIALREMLPKSDLFILMHRDGVAIDSINSFLSQE